MFEFIVILASLILLMVLAYKGFSVLVIAPILAVCAAILASGGEMPGLTSLTEVYMPGLVGFVRTYFPIILAGAIFGKVMGAAGASKSIAIFISEKLGKKRAILSIVLATSLLVYGGISLFVVVFAIYPIGAAIFREVDIPKRLLPGVIALGAFTYAMTAMPGTPQFINTIPISTLGTSIWSAPITGLIGTAVILTLGILWFKKRLAEAVANGEGYGDHDDMHVTAHQGDLPPVSIAIAPLLVIPVITLFLEYSYFKNNAHIYSEPMEKLTGNPAINPLWPVMIALIVATAIAFGIFYKYVEKPKSTLKEGAESSLLPVMNTASEVGYGAVIKALPGFMAFQTTLATLSAPVLAKVALSTTLLAGIVGSSSGGTAIAYGAMGETFKTLAIENGISLDVIHRISIMAAGGLDTLPHSGAVITLLAVTSLTHKESYKDIVVCTIAIPLIAVVVCIISASFGIV